MVTWGGLELVGVMVMVRGMARDCRGCLGKETIGYLSSPLPSLLTLPPLTPHPPVLLTVTMTLLSSGQGGSVAGVRW